MSSFASALRSMGASALRPVPTTSTQTANPLRLRLRSLHQSPSSRRAPIPNHPPPRPPTNGLGTVASAAGNGSRTNGSGTKKPPSAHALWYREIVPAMIPPLLLSLTIFLSLSLLRLHLSHQLSLSEQNTQIELLEQELERLRNQVVKRGEREKRERERMLPVLVGKVLQRVGVLNREAEDEEDREREEQERLLV